MTDELYARYLRARIRESRLQVRVHLAAARVARLECGSEDKRLEWSTSYVVMAKDTRDHTAKLSEYLATAESRVRLEVP